MNHPYPTGQAPDRPDGPFESAQGKRVRVLHWRPARLEGVKAIYVTISIDRAFVVRDILVWQGRGHDVLIRVPEKAELHIDDPSLADEMTTKLKAAYGASVDAPTLLLR